jgi:hypothetical protein
MRELEMGVMLLLLGFAGLLYGLAYIVDGGPAYRDALPNEAARESIILTSTR